MRQGGKSHICDKVCMIKNITIQEKNGKVINNSLYLNVKHIEILGVSKKENSIILEYKDDTISLFNDFLLEEKIEKDVSGRLIYLKKKININIYQSKSTRIQATINIPFPILDNWKLSKGDAKVFITCDSKKVYIRKGDSMRGKVYTVKISKGGIGKTWITAQLGHGLALNGNKVMILTSDSQNNIFDYMIPEKEHEKYKHIKDLRHSVLYGKGEVIPLRKNVDFIPVESSIFTEKFLEKLPEFIEGLRKEYNFILIDSIPTKAIDSAFVSLSDKIIIPVFCDAVTRKEAVNVMMEAGIEKVHSIIVNLFRNTAVQRESYQFLKEFTSEDIVFPGPIKETAHVESLIHKCKTVWESKASSIKSIQNSLLDVIMTM